MLGTDLDFLVSVEEVKMHLSTQLASRKDMTEQLKAKKAAVSCVDFMLTLPSSLSLSVSLSLSLCVSLSFCMQELSKVVDMLGCDFLGHLSVRHGKNA